jgi:uncharacterized MAPEG superfamily protein
MTPELTALALAGLLQMVQLCLMAVPANIQLGPRYTLGPRDQKRELSGVAGRLHRALTNHYEGLILFTAAVVVVSLSGRGSELTEACAWTYLAARVAYVPAYAFGIPYLRTAIWTVGFAATGLMLLAVLVG